MNWQNKLRMCILHRNIQSWRDAGTFQIGELKKGGANINFHADDASENMMTNLISSANDFCIVFGICDHLRKTFEDRP